MVRMSDIFKRKRNSDDEGEKPQPKEESKPIQEQFGQTSQKSAFAPKEPAQEKGTPSAIEPAPEAIIDSPAQPLKKPVDLTGIMKTSKEGSMPAIDAQQEAAHAYQGCLEATNKIIEKIRNGAIAAEQEISGIINSVMGQLETNKDSFAEIAYCGEGEEYLGYHLLNALTFSLIIGISFNYKKAQLLNLGIAAFMSDLGMAYFLDMAQMPRKLTGEEPKKIAEHLNKSLDIFKASGFKDEDGQIINAIEQHHERQDGSGYPAGLKGGRISEAAAIIGLVDTFDALTHRRTYRMLAFDAIKEILDKKFLFDPRILKALIDNVTIYPAGSWVLLNSGEIGRVVKVNPSSPLRPIVQVCYDTNNRLCEDNRVIDLHKRPNIYIKKSLDKHTIDSLPDRNYSK